MSVDEKTAEMVGNLHWNVYALRMNKGLTQNKLAEMASLSHVAISRIEVATEGGISLWSVLNIAQALGVDLNVLFGKKVELLPRKKPRMGRRPNREKGLV